jgi:hypothetical protein
MKPEIVRQKSELWGTPGLYTNPETGFQCRTLELPWRDNLKGKSCIMADTYQLVVWFSPSFKMDVLRLEDKHGRADCLIHPGNWAGDAEQGLFTQVHGCTLPGVAYADIELPNGKGKQHGITSSGMMLRAIMQDLGTGPHQITYRWAEGCEP